MDEALRIRREEQLPIFERLGDRRGIAVTMGDIADMLAVQGELDEALRIRREEELPVYERLGELRQTAITMGKIADVLQARGELDEALRIRREEQLPILERLGDQRSRSVALQKIGAALLEAHGFEQEHRQEIIDALFESFDIARRLDLPDGIAIVGSMLGRLLAAAGHSDAEHVMKMAAGAYKKLGNAEASAQLYCLITETEKEE